jgi:hypothetical protein
LIVNSDRNSLLGPENTKDRSRKNDELQLHHSNNQKVLCITCISFAIFVGAEIIGALVRLNSIM